MGWVGRRGKQSVNSPVLLILPIGANKMESLFPWKVRPPVCLGYKGKALRMGLHLQVQPPACI